MVPRIDLNLRARRGILSGGDDDPTGGMSDIPVPSSGAALPTDGSLSDNPNPSVSQPGPTSPPYPTNTGGSPPGGTGSNGNGGSNPDGGSGVFPTSPVTGSPAGTVNGPTDRHVGLSPAAITAILLSALLVLAILAVAGRLLWRRHRERRGSHHVEALATGARPGHGYSNTSFTFDPQMAERLRGGVIEPYTGAATADSLTSQYRIEPFAVPPRRPPHARTPSTARLLDDAAAFGLDGPSPSAGLKGPRPLPRGAMNLQHYGHTFSGLSAQPTPLVTPMSESNMVFELPPTYASLAQPRPVRRWYQFWPPTTGPGGNRGSGNSGSGSRGNRSGSL